VLSVTEPERARGLRDRIAAFVTPARARTYSALMVVVVLGGYLVSIGAGPFRTGGFTDLAGAVIGADFTAFYWAGHAVVHGRVEQLYDIDAELAFLDALRAPAPSLAEVHAFVSPPYWALFFAPLGALPYPAALALFWALSFALLWLNVRAISAELPELEALGTPARRVALAIGFFPCLFSFLNGQTSMLLLTPLTLTFVLLRRREDFWAGIVLGLLAIKPQIAFGPAVILLFSGRFRALAGAALSASVWLALGLFLMPGAMADYVVLAPELFEFLRQDDYQTWGQTSLYGLVTLLLDPIWHDGATWIGNAMVLLAAGANAIFARRLPWSPGSRRWDLSIAAMLALGLLSSPHLFLYDVSLMLLPLAIVVARLHGEKEGALLDGGPVLAATAVMAATVFFGPYLTLGIHNLLSSHDLPRVALQICTLGMLWFVIEVHSRAAREPA
jgi:hypothetical protein